MEMTNIMQIAESNDFSLIETCDIQSLLYYVCSNTENVDMLKYILENYKEKVNITPEFIAQCYLQSFNNDIYYYEIFNVLFNYDVDDQAYNLIKDEAQEKIESGESMLCDIKSFKNNSATEKVKWYENLAKLKTYIRENGQKPPSYHVNKDIRTLGMWLREQIRNYKEHKDAMADTDERRKIWEGYVTSDGYSLFLSHIPL